MQINSSIQEQWKLLLEQKSIGYTFPGEVGHHYTSANNSAPGSVTQLSVGKTSSNKSTEDDWQFVFPLPNKEENASKMSSSFEYTSKETMPADNTKTESNVFDSNLSESDVSTSSGLLPAARARLLSLRELGSKKIGALKLKLADNRIKTCEKGLAI